jgi:N-acetylglutamate synthase-like GNAT family acetyltransferase
MTGAYFVRPLVHDQISQAFPLVSMLDVALTLEQWCHYAAALIQPGEDRESRRNGVREGPHEGHRMLSVQSGQGHIYGVSAYWLKPDLRRERVMEIENFAVVDVTGTRRAARVLLDGLEARARQADCSCIVISLLHPLIRRRLRDEQEATVDLFKATGFQGDYMRLRKCFKEPA